MRVRAGRGTRREARASPRAGAYGGCPRADRRPVLAAADRPGAGPGLAVQLGGAGVLLGLGGRGRIAAAADGLPGLLVELVLPAVRAARVDGARVAAGLARGDGLQAGGRGRAAALGRS